MASPLQDQSSRYRYLIRKKQEVQRRMLQLQEELHERKKNEALQGSSQRSELYPTKSEVQKLQTHIQQLEDEMNEMFGMASPPQDQSSGSPDMLDLDHLVQKVQDVRQKMLQLQEELHERKKNEALQGSSQQNELDPTKSKVQELQTHIKMKEMAKKRIQLLNECTDCLDQCQSRWISRLKEWKWEQQNAVIGHHFDDDLDPLQSWCEQLFEVNKTLREELQLVGEPMSELQDRLVKLLKVLVQSSLVVDEQPPQVIKILSMFSTTVRCLLGKRVKPVMLKAKIINELQARDLDSELSDDCGELRNNTAILKPFTTSKITRATFWNMRIMNIKRPDSWSSKPETEQKFSLLFSTEIFIPGCDTPCRIQIISLPVVVINDYFQDSSRARATIMWDCAFSEADRVPFMVPEQVPWSTMFNTLNNKFTDEVQTHRSLDQHNQQGLAQKIFNKPDCGDDFSNMMVSWAQLTEVLPGQQFTFWEWFEGLMELTKTHLEAYWSEGLIFGVIGEQKLHQILRNRPAGTFLLHFSDSEIGGIIITYVSAAEEGEPKIKSIPPFTERDLYIHNLGKRIRDISHITHLYPDIPKDEAFKRFYSGPQMFWGYIPLSRIGRVSYSPSRPVRRSTVDVSGTEDERPGGSHCIEALSPLKKHFDAALPLDLPRSMDPSSPSSSSSKLRKGKSRGDRSRRKKKYKKASSTVSSSTDLHDDMLDQPPPATLTETEMTINQFPAADSSSGVSQDNTWEIVLHEPAGPSTLQLSTSDDDDSDSAFNKRKREWVDLSLSSSSTDSESFSWRSLPNTKHEDDSRPVFYPRYTDAYELSSAASESASGAESDAMMEMETTLTASKYSVTNTKPTHCGLQISSSDPGQIKRDSSSLSRSLSAPSPHLCTNIINPEEITALTQTESVPDMVQQGFESVNTDSIDSDDCCVGGCHFLSSPPLVSEQMLHVPDRKDTVGGGPSSTFSISTYSQSTAPTVPQHSQRRKTVLVLKESTVCTEGSKAQNAFEVSSVQSENDSGGDSYTLRMSTQPTHSHLQILSSDPGWSERDSSRLSRSHSVPSLSQTTSPENKTFTRLQSLCGVLSFEEFTPDITSQTLELPPVIDLTADLESFLHFQSGRYCDFRGNDDNITPWLSPASGGDGDYFPTTSSQAQGQAIHLPEKKDTDDGGPSDYCYSPTSSRPSCSQSTAQTFWGPPCPQDSPVVLQDSTVCSEGSRAQDDDVLMETETSDTALNLSVTNNQSTHSHLQLSSSDPGWSERDSSCLSRSHSVPSLSQTTESYSFEEFTPDIIDDEDDETYRFQCSCPGLYQCSVTGLVFHMEGEGDVVYRTVPWDRRLLAQHHKKPAGPLFDIKCLQQSVCQLHLPHCEIRSTGGCEFLSVAHVNDEGIEFIVPQKITETHVSINITGFSGFGNVKDEDSPPDPVRALVLLFYRPPADPNLSPLLNVLLLPVNIEVNNVLRTRKKLVGDEIYIETISDCKLHPKQEYTLSTFPEDDSVLIKPKKAEFYCDNYDNYIPSFKVKFKKIRLNINLVLRDTNSSSTVWDDEVELLTTAGRGSCRQGSSSERLLDIRSSFIDGISGPVLKSLLDKLLEIKVLTDSERESADEIQNHRDKARFVVDTVRKKGEAASSEMIEFLCEVDPFLCKHLGLI